LSPVYVNSHMNNTHIIYLTLKRLYSSDGSVNRISILSRSEANGANECTPDSVQCTIAMICTCSVHRQQMQLLTHHISREIANSRTTVTHFIHYDSSPNCFQMTWAHGLTAANQVLFSKFLRLLTSEDSCKLVCLDRMVWSSFVTVMCALNFWLTRCKNYWNWLRLAIVIHISLLQLLYGPRCWLVDNAVTWW